MGDRDQAVCVVSPELPGHCFGFGPLAFVARIMLRLRSESATFKFSFPNNFCRIPSASRAIGSASVSLPDCLYTLLKSVSDVATSAFSFPNSRRRVASASLSTLSASDILFLAISARPSSLSDAATSGLWRLNCFWQIASAARSISSARSKFPIADRACR